jgi:hypothetical protein
MEPTFIQILILGLVQGAAELLPVSSSAHVIVAEKLMGLDPSSPEMTFLLAMLHTGTLFAVIVYFWKSWKKSFFGSGAAFKDAALKLAAGDGGDRARGVRAHPHREEAAASTAARMPTPRSSSPTFP